MRTQRPRFGSLNFAWAFSIIVMLALQPAVARSEACRILVVEAKTGWPVPLVELRTTHLERFVTDNAGLIAFDSPELMGRETWFTVIGHGYEVPKDGFGYHGVRLKPEPGKTLKVEVNRTVPAQRMGRLTGAGLFAESQKLGEAALLEETGVLGCDSVQNAVFGGRLFWLWGDTTLAKYPLGVFDGTAATTPLQPLASLEPPLRLKYTYFTDAKGAPRGIAPLAGKGPTWLTGLATLKDREGTPHLVASYMKVQGMMDVYEWGQCVWNEEKSVFDPLHILWTRSASGPKAPRVPEGHPVEWLDPEGRQWLLFGNPFPTLRCPATFEAWQNLSTWETLTPQKLLKAAKSGGDIQPHSGSIAWNPHRKRWVTVFMENDGHPSRFGELWYAESEAPIGPWGLAVKVVTHENYTFYNPRLHPEFTEKNSPYLCFEGTYTMQFADKPPPTARYDYNQILYRLDLDEPELAPARGK